MRQERENIYAQAATLVLIISALILVIHYAAERGPADGTSAAGTVSASNAAIAAPAEAGPPVTPPPERAETAAATTTSKKEVVAVKASNKAIKSVPAADTASTSDDFIYRLENPYASPPYTFTYVNVLARRALVNILCTVSSGSLRPISGSGTIIDPRGVILTNAHVAQYVLLAESRRTNVSCYVRTGSPAAIQWVPSVLYIPPVWVAAHAADITANRPVGTGEHDYALLYISESAAARPAPGEFPALSVDARESVGFVDDPVLIASYPAEFVGGMAAANDLYAASSVTNIKQLLTFGAKTADVLSVGGVIEAQSGSSGGAVVNAWGRLIGVITTTSEGATTAERDLRAITLSYIDRDMKAQTGSSLEDILRGDPAARAAEFSGRAGHLVDLLLGQIRQ